MTEVLRGSCGPSGVEGRTPAAGQEPAGLESV
jgi:hypothetical protein